MTFSNDWTVTDNPADHSKFKDQPSFVRKVRTDLADRLANLIYGFTSGETSEGFKKLLLNNQASDAGAPTDAFALYAKDYNNGSTTVSELFARHESAGVIQFTLLGKILVSALVAAGQALGDILYASSATVISRLAGNTTTTKKFLTQTGDGAASAAPAWGTIAAGDVPTLNYAQMASGVPVQNVRATLATALTCSTAIPNDDTKPQITEGTEVVSASITPNNASNYLIIRGRITGQAASACPPIWALFQDSNADAIAAGYGSYANTNETFEIVFSHKMAAGTTSSTTFSVRIAGGGSVTLYVNTGTPGTYTRSLGGVQVAEITIEEVKA